MNQNTRLEIVEFNQDKLVCPVINGEPYTLINPIIESIGLLDRSARRNITNNPRLNRFIMYIKFQSAGLTEARTLENLPAKSDLIITFGAESAQELEAIKGYKYMALPVRKLAAWLYSIDIAKVKEEIRPLLERFQDECDDVLFNHFFGPMAQRKNVLMEKVGIKQRIDELETELNEDSRYVEYVSLKAEEMRLGKVMKRIDVDVINQQMNLFDVNKV